MKKALRVCQNFGCRAYHNLQTLILPASVSGTNLKLEFGEIQMEEASNAHVHQESDLIIEKLSLRPITKSDRRDNP